MLQKELAKRPRSRFETEPDGDGWLAVSSNGMPLCRVKYNGNCIVDDNPYLSKKNSCTATAEAAIKLRDTYIAAARTGKMSMAARMFTVRMTDNPDILDLMCCIPVDESFDGVERMEFAEIPGLCIYYRLCRFLTVHAKSVDFPHGLRYNYNV